MQGLGDIIRANVKAGNPFPEVDANGNGSPWCIARSPEGFTVLHQATGKIVATYSKLRHARKRIAQLILEA